MNRDQFELLLFSTEPAFIRRAVAAGVAGIIVDWEHIGKEARQAAADTQINHDTVEDLARVRSCTDATVICRLNQWDATTPAELEQAIASGADEILLPMVRTVDEIRRVIDLARGRCGVGILVETVAALAILDEVAALPLTRVYVGLNDLAIDRGSTTIFAPIADGTLAKIRRHVTLPFGFGGLTLPDRGYPIPCRLLIGELVRLGAGFSFLRRSFHRDMQGRDLSVEVPRILAAISEAKARHPDAVARDHGDLCAAVLALDCPAGVKA